MSRLTRAELAAYPGDEPIDRWLVDQGEPPPRRPSAALRRQIDLRRFPGRSQLERVMLYLRATLPRAGSWSDESLREIARKLLVEADILG